MIERATGVASRLHVIDAILPLSAYSPFKTTLFKMDRGRYVRTFEQLRIRSLLGSGVTSVNTWNVRGRNCANNSACRVLRYP